MTKKAREEQLRTRCRMAIVGVGLAVCMIPVLATPIEEQEIPAESTEIESESEIIRWKDETEDVSIQPMEEVIVAEPEQELVSLEEFKLTAYCSCEACCSIWSHNRPIDENGNEIVYGASGAVLEAGRSIAVDPGVIPFGTKVYIEGLGEYIAQDTGSAIVGNRIDVYFDDHEAARCFGEQTAEVFLVEE